MKRFLVRTALGRTLMLGRDKLSLLRAAVASPEALGTLANDQLAATLITRLCRPNKTFVDVGAHIGSVLAEVLRHDGSIRCVAVEAMPDKVANLRRRFPSVKVYQCAAGDAEGETSFFVNLKLTGYSSLVRPAMVHAAACQEIRVPMQRLDLIVQDKGVDAIKIDVEGAELGVLRGSTHILTANRPTILFESGPPTTDGFGYSKEALWQGLASQGYAVIVPNRLAHDDPGLTQEGFCESHRYPRRTTNYFAVAKERRQEIRDRARNILGIRAV